VDRQHDEAEDEDAENAEQGAPGVAPLRERIDEHSRKLNCQQDR
jgi:hypothetical protein